MSAQYHLAQLNIARPRGPLDGPVMAEFMANLEQYASLLPSWWSALKVPHRSS